ncbi:MAG: TorF family putative porin [Hyphomicrobiaceae bacterium]|nr:TorF family putative porin [Hyphomicrobiaceae bacterium]
MTLSSKFLNTVALATVSVFALSTAALADGYAGGSMKDAPAAAPERQFTWSVNGGIMSDYVFRGVSQNDEDPSIFVGADVGYGIFYAGIWAAEVSETFVASNAEIDLYAGIKPVLGPVTFDLGVIYYAYNDQNAGPVNVDYVELKLGASMSPFENATIGGNFFFSPDYTFETGEVYTVEGYASYTLPQMWIFTPSVSALVGYQTGEDDIYETFNGFDEYVYWNAGFTLAVEKLSFDFRYWDTDIDVGGGAVVDDLADERFVFTAKVVLP